MRHAEAIETKAVERYLLGELPASSLEEFEEHFFDCAKCAEDLRMATLFLNTTKSVMAAEDVLDHGRIGLRQRFSWLRPQYALAACMVLLVFISYQNLVLIPKLRISSSPQTLAIFSFAELGARDLTDIVIAPQQTKPFILLLDVPVDGSFAEYRFEILTQNEDKVLSVNIFATGATKPVPIFIPPSLLKPATYSLIILGRPEGEGTSYKEIERRSFRVE
jgi:hypothetical protein